MSDSEIQSLWDDRVGWSKTADRLKSTRDQWRTIVLVLTVAGAALQTAAATWAVQKTAFGIVGTVALAAVAFIGSQFLKPESTKKWLRARSVSEGMKSEIYSFRAGADPYNDVDGLERLRAKLREIYSYARDLELERAKTGKVTSPAPSMLDHEQYKNARVTQQIEKYYEPKAQLNARRAETFHRLEIAFAAISALLGAAATLIGSGDATATPLNAWVAVFTTIAGTFAAHAAASRFEFQATTYYATARQLTDLRNAWDSNKDEADNAEWSKFVRACEEVISAENRDWMAKAEQNQ